MVRTAILLSLVTCMVGLGQGERATSRPSAPTVQELIAGLDSESFEARNRSTEGLRALGETARPALEEARKSPSLEVRTRAESLLGELDGAASPSKDGTPSELQEKVRRLRPVDPTERSQEDVAPDSEPHALPEMPRFQDFGDPNAYFDAVRKYMEETTKAMNSRRSFGFTMPPGIEMLPGGGSRIEIAPNGDLQYSVTRIIDGESVEFSKNSGGVTMKVTTRGAGEEKKVETYEAKDVEELKSKFPDVWEKYGKAGGFELNANPFTFRVEPGPYSVPRVGRQRGAAPRPDSDRSRVRPLTPAAPEPVASGPRLGIEAGEIPPILDAQLKLKGQGVAVEAVETNSLASRLGLRQYDVLLEVDGVPIRSADDIRRQMAAADGTATVRVKILRDGASQELSAPRARSR